MRPIDLWSLGILSCAFVACSKIPSSCFEDADGDGFGGATTVEVFGRCVEAGHVDNSADCDDTSPEVHPDVAEIPYDGIDNDCDAATLEDDLDEDAFTRSEDCNDDDAQVHPGATELVYDGVDNDCDEATLDDDLDQDGFRLTDDCDHENDQIRPDASETPYDGVDNDCDAETLDDDLDQDGFVLADDCDDRDSSISPASNEVPYDGVDNDCDLVTLDDDLDQDGFLFADDCDDSNAAVNPGAIHASCAAALEAGQTTDGTYHVDPDGVGSGIDGFCAYCDMTTDGGGWTLFANHADGIPTKTAIPVVTPTQYGVLTDERWAAVLANMDTGMLFTDEFGRVSRLDLSTIQNANCWTPYDHATLTGPERHRIFHHENSGCNNTGQDYSIVVMAGNVVGCGSLAVT